MLIHQQAIRQTSKSNISISASCCKVTIASSAACAQASGMAWLNALAKSLSAKSLDSDATSSESETPVASSSAPSDEDLRLLDITAVREELQR